MEKYIRESNLIEGIDSPEEDRRSMRAWKWALGNTDMMFTTGYVLELHRRITLKQLPKRQRGHWRTVQVYVGDYVPPAPAFVVYQISDFLDGLRYDYKAIDPILAHIRFEAIHPFIDGNGRTGRMLLWLHQLKRNLEPTLFLNAEKHDKYYPLFK